MDPAGNEIPVVAMETVPTVHPTMDIGTDDGTMEKAIPKGASVVATKVTAVYNKRTVVMGMTIMDKLRRSFVSIKLFPDTLDIAPNKNAHCYFIVQKPFNSKLASELLASFVLKGCRDFVFWGMEQNQWHTACDMVDIENNRAWEEDISLTTSYDEIGEFAYELKLNLEIADPSEPFFLFYDDMDAYSEVVKRLWHY